MKTLRATLAFPLLFAAGWSLQVLEMVMRYDYITGTLMFAAAVQVAIWLAVIVPAFFVLDFVLRRTRSMVAEAAVIAILCVVCALVGQVIYGDLAWSHRWYHRGDRDYLLFDDRAATVMRLATRRSLTPILISAAALLMGRFLLARREERDRELREQRLETRLSEARLQLLRSQLNPHFLFNALNSVMALVRSDPHAAQQMLERLSRFYEITASTEGRAWIALDEEIGFAREYLDIEQVRFGARLTVDIEDADVDARVPALLLQPLVENAIKHGVAKTPGPVWVRLHASRDGRSLRVEIGNRGAYDARAEGVGLANTRERLRQAYGDAAALHIESDRDATRVVVTIAEAAA
jgi:anti-sigma regulatory factor (Ser/Thr protein kinase)